MESGAPHAAGSGAAPDHVLHHVYHYPRLFLREHLAPRRSLLPENFLPRILDAKNCVGRGADSLVGEGGISRDELHRIDIRGADMN